MELVLSFLSASGCQGKQDSLSNKKVQKLKPKDDINIAVIFHQIHTPTQYCTDLFNSIQFKALYSTCMEQFHHTETGL